MFVLVYLLEEYLVIWNETTSKDKAKALLDLTRHEMAIPSISSRTGATISSNARQNSSIVGGVGILVCMDQLIVCVHQTVLYKGTTDVDSE